MELVEAIQRYLATQSLEDLKAIKTYFQYCPEPTTYILTRQGKASEYLIWHPDKQQLHHCTLKNSA